MSQVLTKFLDKFETEWRQVHRRLPGERLQDNLAYRTWCAMHSRCYYPKDKSWKWYGGKGIQVCLRWHKSTPNAFNNFVSDLGPRLPGLTIDRLNSELSYMPSNCCWATRYEQMRHHRRNN